MEGKSGSDDVYEFKSSKEATPVRGSSASPDVEKQDGTGTVADVKENNSPLRSEGGGEQSSKRSFSDVQDSEEGDEENKRRKHKDSDCGKDSSRNGGSSGRFSSGRKGNSGGKCVKSCNDGKNGSNTGTKGTGSNDRKSPNNTTSSTGNSPKPSGGSGKSSTNIGNESDGDKEIRSTKGSSNSSDNSGGGSGVWTGAPKVPPLKIVIPQQNSSIEQEQGNRNGKNGTARHHQALPYVVASSNSGEGGNEKEGTGSGQNVQTSTGQSDSSTPGNQVKGDDKKETGTGNTTSEEQRSSHHQRVLRSSHRSGGSNSSGGSGSGSQSTMSSSLGGSLSSSGTTSVSSASSPSPVSNSANADRSNNSSPQQSGSQRQTPSPTGSSTTVSTENNAAIVSKNSSSNTSNTLNTEEKGSESMEQCNQQQHQSASSQQSPAVELHPRKRKMKQNKESQAAAATASTTTNTTSSTITESTETSNTTAEVNPHELALNSYQLYLNIRKQIDKRRKSLFPVQPKPPQGFKDYLMNRCTYVLAGSQSTNRPMPLLVPPPSLQSALKDLFQDQEKERHRLRMQHVIEKEKLVLSVEQEILRVHGRAARALANQSLPFSVCTILKDEEVYNIMTADQEDKDQNARSRYNGRLFLSWLQDVDDKWEKIKETMLLRHHNEAETLHAVQKMDWEWKMKELAICEFKTKPVIDDQHVPKVQVHDDFDLLPA